MENRQNVRLIGVTLVSSLSAVAIAVSNFPPDSDFILSPGFSRREELGYIHGQEPKHDSECNNNVYINERQNHTATLTSDFNDTLKIKVTAKSYNSNPLIIIKSPDGKIHLCENSPGDGEVGDQQEIVFFSYEYVDGEAIPGGTYQVWVGDTKKNSGSTKYTIEVTEEEEPF